MDARSMTCPYCQTRLLPGERVRECAQCHNPHHENCWNENGGCTTFGCSGHSPSTFSPAAPPTAYATADHIELSLDDLAHCASCGAALSVWDTNCPRCHASTSLPPSLARPQPGQLQPYAGMPYQPPMGNSYQPTAYRPQHKSPIGACLLNLLLLGAGYFYLNQVGKGLVVLLIGLVLGAITSGILALAVLVYAMVDCYQSAERMNRGERL